MDTPTKIALTPEEQFLAENRREGEEYAGIILGKNGEKDYHLFLLPDIAKNVTWAQAKDFARMCGGDLPTRREQSLLFANLKERFRPRFYWSGDALAFDSDPLDFDEIWMQDFEQGHQFTCSVDTWSRARVVRRLEIL